MKKIILSILIVATSSVSFATEKKQARKPNTEVCSAEAAQVALGAVKALGRDVTVSKVTFVKEESKRVLKFSVKLEGNGFISPETDKPLTVRLVDYDDSCGFKSISL
ncbi:MAG: hypothetical protein V4654_11950 [Bdellovibrionota bacterium]